MVHVDGKFEPLKPLMQAMPGSPMVNTTSANKHVPEIKQRVRVVKEKSSATKHGLPFSRMPKLIAMFIAFAAAKMLNLFPPKGGASAILSPRTIMSGKTLDHKKHFALRIGQHCQVHQEDAPCNSQLPRTKGAIALGPGGNLQGSFKFVALDSGKKITRRNWDVIPMTDAVVTQVNELGRDQPEQSVFAD